MKLRRLGTHLLYTALMALWVYLGYLANGFRPDAAFTFWITSIAGGILTLIRWFRLVRGTAPVHHVSDEDTSVDPPSAVDAPTGRQLAGDEAGSVKGPSTTSTDERRDAHGGSLLTLSDESWRIARVVGSFVVVLVGMLLVGMHIILPLFVAGYLYLWGEVRSWIALVSAALGIFAAIVLVFDFLLLTPWPVSSLEEVLEVRWGRLFSGYIPL